MRPTVAQARAYCSSACCSPFSPPLRERSVYPHPECLFDTNAVLKGLGLEHVTVRHHRVLTDDQDSVADRNIDIWGHGFGTLPRADGTPYATEKGAFRNHPCTIWANDYVMNWQWLLAHGFALCSEYAARYGKVHTCFTTLNAAKEILPTGDPTGRSGKGPKDFVFAGPDEFKLDTSISIYDKYKMYIASKPWVKDNYLRLPHRKPEWV